MLLSSCSRETPTSPTQPGPPASNLPPASAVLSISIVGDMWVPTTSTGVKHTARLITSTSPLDYVDGSDGVAWTVEPAGVAAVDRHGNVTPLAIGTATVKATYNDKSGTNNIRVLPDYSGSWSGQFRITGCTGGNDFRECGRMMNGAGAGSGTGFGETPFYPFLVTLTQFRDQVTGTVREPRPSGELQYPVTGIVRVNGQLVIEATTPKDGDSLRVFNWASTANAGVTSMSGAFTKIEPYRNAFGTPYTIRTEHEFTGLSRAQ
jgi:hypothetical protein